MNEIEAAAQAAYAAFLQSCRDAGEGLGGLPVVAGARYLGEQRALAITRRASGEDQARIREMLALALSVLTRSQQGRPRADAAPKTLWFVRKWRTMRNEDENLYPIEIKI